MNFGLCCLVKNCTYTPITKTLSTSETPHNADCNGSLNYVDEYGPELHYVEGSANVVDDAFSRLSWKDNPTGFHPVWYSSVPDCPKKIF
jgi:hypothetical protein